MSDAANSSLIVALSVIAISSIAAAGSLYWLAKNLIVSSHSLKSLIETVDVNLNTTLTKLQQSIEDINKITGEAGRKLEKLDVIVENVEQISADIRSSADMVNRTVSPTLGNLHAISAGARKALETWNEFGEGKRGGDCTGESGNEA